jgi:hypothetical protein
MGTTAIKSKSLCEPLLITLFIDTTLFRCTKSCPSGCGYYSLAYVPRHAKLEPLHQGTTNGGHIPTSLSSSYSIVKATIAIVQVLYASATVYKATQGPEIDQYGYAAFGLTVIP